MSYVINPELPRGASETRIFNFAAGAALNTKIIGSDQGTGETFFNLAGANSVLRMIIPGLLDSTTDRRYRVVIARDTREVAKFYTPQLTQDSAVLPPVYPANLQPGQYQMYLYQELGDLEAIDLMVTFQTPLI